MNKALISTSEIINKAEDEYQVYLTQLSSSSSPSNKGINTESITVLEHSKNQKQYKIKNFLK